MQLCAQCWTHLIYIQTAVGARIIKSIFFQLFLPLFLSFNHLLSESEPLSHLNIPEVDDLVLGKVSAIASNFRQRKVPLHSAGLDHLKYLLQGPQKECCQSKALRLYNSYNHCPCARPAHVAESGTRARLQFLQKKWKTLKVGFDVKT